MRTAHGAAGLTLTMATVAYMLDPSTDPAIERQAVSRLHRLGQAHEVQVNRLLCRGTVEEYLVSAANTRRSMVATRDNAEWVDTTLAMLGISTST